jgi:hypothetical protein
VLLVRARLGSVVAKVVHDRVAQEPEEQMHMGAMPADHKMPHAR